MAADFQPDYHSMDRLDHANAIGEPAITAPEVSSYLLAPKLWPAVARGLLCAIVGGALWGMLTFAIGVRVEYVPIISVGYFVGMAVRGSNCRSDWRFGFAGAFLALAGCFVADNLSLWGTVILQLGFLPQRAFQLEAMYLIFVDQWRLTDTFVYCFAAWEGFHLATRRQGGSPWFLPGILHKNRERASCLLLVIGVFLFGVFWLNVHRTKIVDVSLSRDGTQLAASRSGYDTTCEQVVLLWNLPNLQHSVLSSLGVETVGRLAWSPNGDLLAFVSNAHTSDSSNPGRVSLWHFGQRLKVDLVGHSDFVECLAFSPDGGVLVTGSQDRSVRLWDLRKHAVQAIIAQPCAVSAVTFSRDGKVLAVGLRDGTISIIDIPALVERASRKVHRAAVSSLLFDFDSHCLYSAGSVDATVKVWDTAAFQEKLAVKMPIGWITALTLSPDGQSLAVSGGSFHRPGVVWLLDAATGQESKCFEVQANTVCAAVFTLDGKTLIAGTAAPISPFALRRHGEIYRWDVITGALLEPLP